MTRIAIGTEKGAYILTESNGDWGVSGPLFPGWKVTAFGKVGETHLAAVASNWFGVGIHRSPDLKDWEPVDNPPAWPEGSGRKMEKIWRFHRDADSVWAGVAHAGVFRSWDAGLNWEPVTGLNEHTTRDEWQPGLGGLAAHRILTSGDRSWIAISAVGVFRSDDSGQTWHLKNDGVDPVDNPGPDRPEVGYCVHALAQDPAEPDHLWRQDHRGMYRSLDGGETWQRANEGLPADFGFVIWRDNGSGRLLTIPLESDQNRLPVAGRLRAYASDDMGEHWAVAGTGWRPYPQFTGVLRGAFDGDGKGTFVFGTTGGEVWLTSDIGATWSALGPTFPRIGAVALV